MKLLCYPPYNSSSHSICLSVLPIQSLLPGIQTRVKLISQSSKWRCFQISSPPTCQLSCSQPEATGDLQHFLVQCSSLAYRRSVLFDYWGNITLAHPVCHNIVESMKISSQEKFTQFLLDCSVIPEVIELSDRHGKYILDVLFKMTRTYCYSLHRERLKLLNRWSC